MAFQISRVTARRLRCCGPELNMKKRLLVLRRCEPAVHVHHVAACRRRRKRVIYCECQKNHAASIGGTPSTDAESSWLKERRGLSELSSVLHAAATAASIEGCKNVRLYVNVLHCHCGGSRNTVSVCLWVWKLIKLVSIL